MSPLARAQLQRAAFPLQDTIVGTLLGISVPLPCQKVPSDVMEEYIHIAPSMGGEEPFCPMESAGLGQVKETVDHGSPAHTGESTGTSVGLHLWKPMLYPGAMIGQWNLAKGDLQFKPEEEMSEEVGDCLKGIHVPYVNH